MSETCDALIIGAGITGAAITFELGKKGFRTLNVDKLPGAGLGSTANTCAIIRTTYSTLAGTAMAYDAYFSWKNWADYLDLHDTLGIPYQVWDREKLLKTMPHFVDDSFYPPRRFDDPAFTDPPTAKLCDRAILFPCGGYINDAVLSVQNLQQAAQNRGGKFLFNRAVTAIRICTERRVPQVISGAQFLGFTAPMTVAGALALAGVNIIHDVGYMDMGMACSCGMMVLGDEILNWVKRFIQGITVNARTLAAEVVQAAGPGGHFLTQKHTIDYMRMEAWQPELFFKDSYDAWVKAGSATLAQRADEKAARLIREHSPEPLDEAVAARIREIREKGAAQIEKAG